MTIPPRFLNELRDRLTLSDIVGKRVRLSRAGREFKGCCPFHNEKTPSFYVNDDKQFYHCFGCGAHGDAVGFVMQNDNLSFIDAVEMLASEAGMQVPKQTPQEVEKAKKQKDLYSLMEEATRFFEKQLRNRTHEDALGYMTERGMPEELLGKFRIGFAPAEGEVLRKYLMAAGYTDEQMIEAGVLRESTRGGEPYAFFRDRIMFPVSDRRGRVVAFGGRILPEHMRPPSRSDFKPPKYINSSDTPLFHKGRMLYNEAHARQAAADSEPVVVVEGYMDVMAMFEAGWHGAVAPMGTALTEDQILSLWKMIPERTKAPILCFDGDNAGRKAAARAAERVLPLLQPDHSVRIAFLPEGQDPDSLIKSQGRSGIESILNSAMPLADFLWLLHTDGQNFETPESRAGLAKVLEIEVVKISDRSVQVYYRQAFQEKLRAAFGWRAMSFKQFGRGMATGDMASGMRLRRPAFAGSRVPQMVLLACALNHPALYAQMEDKLERLELQDARLDLLRAAIMQTMESHQEESPLDRAALHSHLISSGFKAELNLILSEAVYVHAGFARPDSAEEIVMRGWQEMIGSMERQSMRRELKSAGQMLAHDFSPENEQRMIALHGMHKDDED